MIPFVATAEEQSRYREDAARPTLRAAPVTTDFGRQRQPIHRIVVLKLDHFGDFVIGLPALRALREAYPQATIRLICGRWNARNALSCGLVDEVRTFNYFPEHPHGGTPADADPIGVLDEAVAGHFDLAIDLRVDEDTRPLLARIDARLRCGIGPVQRFPLLDIALPEEHFQRAIRLPPGLQGRYLAPGIFSSALPRHTPLLHSGPFEAGDIFKGPFTELPPGRLLAAVNLRVARHLPNPIAASIKIDVVRDQEEIVASQVFGRRNIHKLRHEPAVFEFDNPDERARYEFRAHVAGRPLTGEIQFSGVTVQQLSVPPRARYHPVTLHVGEKLSLLVALIRERTTDLYEGFARQSDAVAASLPGKSFLPRIAVAPFSNSSTRDWPVGHYARLLSTMLDEIPCEIILIGTSNQEQASKALDAGVGSPRLVNLTGRTVWGELPAVLRGCDLVICNNSGIAHLGAAAGARVLAIYSGSHQPQEWGPRGMSASAITLPTFCSPCGFERVAECPMDHMCMTQITPETVLAEVKRLLNAEHAKRELTTA